MPAAAAQQQKYMMGYESNVLGYLQLALQLILIIDAFVSCNLVLSAMLYT